jgi:pimeloyl-ACP methyl ester carboxylesterase
LQHVQQQRRCCFPSLERAVARFGKPLLMIHGGQDTYIKPEMARALFEQAAGPREFWVVEGAKHNQALHLAGEEYRRRVLEFFERHLASVPEQAAEEQVSSSSRQDARYCEAALGRSA